LCTRWADYFNDLVGGGRNNAPGKTHQGAADESHLQDCEVAA